MSIDLGVSIEGYHFAHSSSRTREATSSKLDDKQTLMQENYELGSE